MARVTVEDCIQRVPNRFDLVLLAAQRSRDIISGAPLAVERDNDKSPVVALREIAEDKLDLPRLQEALVKGLQKHHEIDQPEDDVISSMPTAEELGVAAAAIRGDLDADDEGDGELVGTGAEASDEDDEA